METNPEDVHSPLIGTEDIKSLTRYKLVQHITAGMAQDVGMAISVMLDLDEADSQISHGTGKHFIRETLIPTLYCELLNTWPDEIVSSMCAKCHRDDFDRIKKRVLSNPNYAGESHLCCAGLWSLNVPIVERKTNSFIGVLFGAAKRLQASPRATETHLRNFLAEEKNAWLRSVPFRRLLRSYLLIPEISDEKLSEVHETAKRFANELSMPFETIASLRWERSNKELQNHVTACINELLLEAHSWQDLLGKMGLILEALQKWLSYDWAFFVRRSRFSTAQAPCALESVIGRGIQKHKVPRGDDSLHLGDVPESAHEVLFKPGFLKETVGALVSGDPDYWWFPLADNHVKFYGAIVLGSAPEHSNTQYKKSQIERNESGVQEVARSILIAYSYLLKTAEKDRTIKEKESALKTEREEKTLLRRTILSLTHKLKRPLVIAETALWNVQNLYNQVSWSDLQKHIASGCAVARHGHILCTGISNAFASEAGRTEFDVKRTAIKVKSLLEELCRTMHEDSGRTDISFELFNMNPTILMNYDSFLYVFYALVDNAIKYSNPGTTVTIGFEHEYDLGRPAFKIKSYGLPLPDQATTFTLFERGEEARRRDESGIGLGCWAAKTHMKNLGGDIYATSEGQLSVFVVVLPPNSLIVEGDPNG